jgi:hypothetical protein
MKHKPRKFANTQRCWQHCVIGHRAQAVFLLILLLLLCPRWLVPPEVLHPAGLLHEPGFGSSHLYRVEPHSYNDARDL